MKLDLFDREGNKLKAIDVDDAVFGVKPHRALVHQALVAHRANQRQGTHKAKRRGEVAGSTIKLYRQKGTGRSRQGAARAPHRTGGGIVFGPLPRSYRKELPKRMRRLAIRSVLSAKAADGDLKVVDALAIDAPKTKDMLSTLASLGFDRSTLVVTSEPDANVRRSLRNIPKTRWMPASYLNVLDLLAHRGLLMTQDAVRAAEALWGGERAGQRRAAKAAPAVDGTEAEAKPKRTRKKTEDVDA
jgi:large subunit ribosomal protein L4